MLYADSGHNFISEEFHQNATALAITIKIASVESHNSIGLVERYHALLRRAYEIIAMDMPQLDKHQTLQMAVKAVNDTASSNSLVLTLLLFEAYLQIT